MDIKQLINFITIVEEGNITKAAQKLHISQPPLSNQLKALEEELGVKLVERGSRKVTLTDVGNLLYKRGKDMVDVFESTLNEIEDFKSGIEGVLKIGAVSTCNQFIPNKLISPYAKQYPKVKFELYEGNTYVEAVFHTIRPTSTGLIVGACWGVVEITMFYLDKYNITSKFVDLFNFKSIIFAFILFFLIKYTNKHPVIYIALSAVVGILLSF